jgi:hypothetical protein
MTHTTLHASAILWWPDVVYFAVPVAIGLATLWQAGTVSGGRRFGTYAVYWVGLVVVSFVVAVAYFDNVLCGRGTGDECDLAPVLGIVWAFFALVGYPIAVALNEWRLSAVRRRRAL